MKAFYKRWWRWIWLLGVGIVLLIMLGRVVGQGVNVAVTDNLMQQTRSIGMAMYRYSLNHGGKYPTGASSTEVFQQLLDGKYVEDSDNFYVAMPGKVRGVPGERLKPENVSFDVTGDMDAQASEMLPMVFITGYRVEYGPYGGAIPRLPYARFAPGRGWLSWLMGAPQISFGGMVVAYKGNCVAFLKLVDSPDMGWWIPHALPDEFDVKGKVYRQLGPEGVMR